MANTISKTSVSVETAYYISAVGHTPKGLGDWAFGIGNRNPDVNDIFWAYGLYSDAKKKAIAKAAEMGVIRVYVLS